MIIISLDCKCGIEGKLNNTGVKPVVEMEILRISGGKPVNPTGKYPWIAYLRSIHHSKFFFKQIV